MNTEGKKAVLVSLVTYNDEAFLARCLEAVQNQTIPIRVKIFENACEHLKMGLGTSPKALAFHSTNRERIWAIVLDTTTTFWMKILTLFCF